MSPRSDATNRQLRAAATDALLAAAQEVFAERGLHDATIGEITRRAGVSKGLAYHYFRSKDDLLVAIVERRLREVLAIFAALPAAAPAPERLRLLVDASLAHAAEHAALYRCYLGLFLQPGGARAIERAGEALGGDFAALEGALLALFRDLGAADPAIEAAYFRAKLDGMIQHLILAPERFPLAALRARLLADYPGPPTR